VYNSNSHSSKENNFCSRTAATAVVQPTATATTTHSKEHRLIRSVIQQTQLNTKDLPVKMHTAQPYTSQTYNCWSGHISISYSIQQNKWYQENNSKQLLILRKQLLLKEAQG
jgi:hypothetical protein